jgi:hypothetical protein
VVLGGLGLGCEGRAGDFRGGRGTVAKMHCAVWISSQYWPVLGFY